jgi:purine-cytosine permease-like protein
MVLGAAIGGAVGNVPSWSDANTADSVGGVLAAMLEPAGGFGKFVIVLIALSPLGNTSASLYSVSLNLQMMVPMFTRIPRALFSIVITAIFIPVSIKAAVSFYNSLENFIGIIGYWSAAFVAAVLMEHASFGLVIPCMYENWYVGPIAETTGDIGFEMAFCITALLYLPLRYLEIRMRGRL